MGREQDAVLEGIASDRARCCQTGIYAADVVLIPLEDGDRAEALRAAGKKVLAIDLNPLSRTAQAANATAVDEITRAVPQIRQAVKELQNDQPRRKKLLADFDNQANLAESVQYIIENLTAQQ